MPEFGYTGKLRPQPISPYRTVPDHIPRPDYATRPDGFPKEEQESKQQRVVKTWEGEDLEKISRTCRFAREVLDEAHK